MAAMKSAAKAFKLMNESSAKKSRVLKDANDDALFSRPGRQPDTMSEAYYKLREEQAYLERQKYVMKLRKELPGAAQSPPVITIDEEAEEEEEEGGGMGRSPSLYDTLDLNADAGGS
jgi:hypothetical protein